MEARITEAQVRHIAKLSRLNLADDEVQRMAAQLGDILGYIRQLEQIDTSGVEPLAHPLPITNVQREDEPLPGFDSDVSLANAPQRERDFFRVPAVLDQDSGA